MKRKVTRFAVQASFLAVFLFGQVAHAQPAPASTIDFEAAMAEAEAVASNAQGRWVVRCDGDSMAPVFGRNTLAVVAEVGYEHLRPGVIAVYERESGQWVAHQIVAADGDGWRAKGISNAGVDDENVTFDNLIGILYATFNTSGFPVDAEGDSRVAGLPVVVGAAER